MSSSNEAEDEEQPQLTSIVIITLPPSDNPSLGKTITAYTLSNPSNQPPPPPSLPLPLQPKRTRHPIFTLSVIFLFALLTFAYLQSSQSLITLTTSFGSSPTEVDQTHNDNDNDEDEKKVNAFVFPLYPKLGFGEMYKMRDMEVKLGKFMMFGGKSSVLPVVDNDGGFMMSAKVVSGGNSVVLPVNGDDLRDGHGIINLGNHNKGNVCLGILDGSDLLDGSHIIFGDISMRGNLIVYDNVKQKIGWMRSECINPKQSNNYLPSL